MSYLRDPYAGGGRDMITYSLCVELDVSKTPSVVRNVVPMIWYANPPYQIRPSRMDKEGNVVGVRGPYAVLTEVTARSHQEAETALKGLIQGDKDLAWVLTFPEVKTFLSPPWSMLG